MKATDGDTSNKDKLAEAMAKVKFDAPRGPFRFDPVTHNPDPEHLHLSKSDRERRQASSTKVISHAKDVQDPGKKDLLSVGGSSAARDWASSGRMEFLARPASERRWSTAMLLFLMAAGLSLIFGLMNVVSLAHGSFFMLGAFFGLSIFQLHAAASGWRSLLAPIPVAALGVVMEIVFLRPLYRRGHMDQVLLTFGFTFVFFDVVQTVWGRVVFGCRCRSSCRASSRSGSASSPPTGCS